MCKLDLIFPGLLVCMIAAGCGNRDGTRVAAPPVSLETDEDELRELKSIPHVPAQGARATNRTPFFVEARANNLTQFPCTRCHEEPFAESLPPEIQRRTMHLDIVSNHAPGEIMNCITCHNPDDMDTLRLGNADPVAMDHAYRLCSVCHFEQARDWAGGAHGKRLAGWLGKRVIMNCASCHDPHEPQFDIRWPAATPRIPRKVEMP